MDGDSLRVDAEAPPKRKGRPPNAVLPAALIAERRAKSEAWRNKLKDQCSSAQRLLQACNMTTAVKKQVEKLLNSYRKLEEKQAALTEKQRDVFVPRRMALSEFLEANGVIFPPTGDRDPPTVSKVTAASCENVPDGLPLRSASVEEPPAVVFVEQRDPPPTRVEDLRVPPTPPVPDEPAPCAAPDASVLASVHMETDETDEPRQPVASYTEDAPAYAPVRIFPSDLSSMDERSKGRKRLTDPDGERSQQRECAAPYLAGNYVDSAKRTALSSHASSNAAQSDHSVVSRGGSQLGGTADFYGATARPAAEPIKCNSNPFRRRAGIGSIS